MTALREAEGRIEGAWMAGVVSGGVSLLFAALLVRGSTRVHRGDLVNLADVALVFALAFGVARRSRVCAVLLVALAVAGFAYATYLGLPWIVRLTNVGFGYFYARGVLGTIAYHRLREAPATKPRG